MEIGIGVQKRDVAGEVMLKTQRPDETIAHV